MTPTDDQHLTASRNHRKTYRSERAKLTATIRQLNATFRQQLASAGRDTRETLYWHFKARMTALQKDKRELSERIRGLQRKYQNFRVTAVAAAEGQVGEVGMTDKVGMTGEVDTPRYTIIQPASTRYDNMDVQHRRYHSTGTATATAAGTVTAAGMRPVTTNDLLMTPPLVVPWNTNKKLLAPSME